MAFQINLVNPSFRPQRTGLNHRVIVIAGVAAWALLHVYGQTVAGSVKTLSQRVTEADARITALKAEVEKTTEASKKREPDKKLIDEIARLELRLEVQRDTLLALDTGGLGNSEGFSGYLTAFARRATTGVWLTKIVVDSATNDVQLKGRVLKAELLPDYIRRLGDEAALRDKRFGDLVVTAKTLSLPAAPAQPAKAMGTAGGPGRPAVAGIDGRPGGAGTVTGAATVDEGPPSPESVPIHEFTLGGLDERERRR